MSTEIELLLERRKKLLEAVAQAKIQLAFRELQKAPASQLIRLQEELDAVEEVLQ